MKVILFACLLTSNALAQTTSWDVLAARAKPDGATDSTAIFQRLLDEAGKAGGGVVNVPAGSFRIAGNLSIPANVTLQGIYRVPPTVRSGKTAELTGSVLQAMTGRGSNATAKPSEPRPLPPLSPAESRRSGQRIAAPSLRRPRVGFGCPVLGPWLGR